MSSENINSNSVDKWWALFGILDLINYYFLFFSGVQDLDEVIKKSNYKKLQDDWQDVS